MRSVVRSAGTAVLAAVALVPAFAQSKDVFVMSRAGWSVAVDGTGGELLAPKGYWFVGFAEGMFVVSDGRQVGFADAAGRTVIPLRYAWAWPFRDGRAVVEFPGGGTGYIDRTGALVGRADFKGAHDFHEDRAVVITRSGYAFVNRRAKVVIPGPFDMAEDFSEGLAPVMRAYRWGYVDRAGRQAIPIQFGAAGQFVGGLAPATVARTEQIAFGEPIEGTGFIDASGRFVIAPKYSAAEPFSDGLALVTAGSVYRPSTNHLGREMAKGWQMFIDRTGAVRIVIAEDVVRVRSFREGLAYVEYKNGRKGFIDRTGTCVVWLDVWAAGAGDFQNGCARVSYADGRTGLIDRRGVYVWPPTN